MVNPELHSSLYVTSGTQQEMFGVMCLEKKIEFAQRYLKIHCKSTLVQMRIEPGSSLWGKHKNQRSVNCLLLENIRSNCSLPHFFFTQGPQKSWTFPRVSGWNPDPSEIKRTFSVDLNRARISPVVIQDGEIIWNNLLFRKTLGNLCNSLQKAPTHESHSKYWYSLIL